MRYCTRCIMPETKPDLWFDTEGVCSACRYYEQREQVDWDARWHELQTITNRYQSPSNYDCIVPCSGGKDSTYQTLKILELGLRPLCVTASTDHLTDIGRANIENLKQQGVDYLEVTTNPVLRRRLNKMALEDVGDISWPEHITIFTIPVRVAVAFKVPLIIWGENPQNEYGGPAAAATRASLSRAWLEEFGGLLGLRVSDVIRQQGLTARDLLQYTYPTQEELSQVGVTGLFLGYYVPWDGYTNALYSQAHGLTTYPVCVEGSMVNYENLDNAHTGIHDYFKWLKYGFGRATDLACMHIRRGRLSRKDAITIIQDHDGRYPSSYLGISLDTILEEIRMTRQEFEQVCDRFTNKKLFRCQDTGELIKDAQGRPTLCSPPA